MKLNSFKKEIIEFFQLQHHPEEGIFEITQKDFDAHFKKNLNILKNLETLIAHGIINRSTKGGEPILRFFQRDHPIEVRKILNYKALEDLALMMQPSNESTKNLDKRFYEHADQKQSEGVYYFYTEKGDPDCWIVLAREDVKKEPHRYRLGSIEDPNSKLYEMWLATVQAWNGNGKQSIRRGMAEKIDQDAFGNNRQPGFAAFKLFTHAGWLRIPHGNNTSIFYNVEDEKIHLDQQNLNQFTKDILKRWGMDD